MHARTILCCSVVTFCLLLDPVSGQAQLPPSLRFGPDSWTRTPVRGLKQESSSGVNNLGGDDPFADVVIDYDPGSNAAVGFTTASTALGSPERFTGEGVFPSAVTVFNSPFGTDEIVSIGEGGSLVVMFGTPVTDDPDNLFGIDLLVFGNALLAFEGAGVGNPAGIFSEPAPIEVSVDGITWVVVPGVQADDLFPTEGYQDLVDPFATTPGSVDSHFTRPVDPALTLADFSGLTYAQVLDLYNGSGGGAGVDIGGLGLTEISYVRITNPLASGVTPEIDAFVDVEPRRPGDVDLDGAVNVVDLLLLLSAWGGTSPGAPPADFDNNGFVEVIDLLTLLANWD